MKQLKTERGVVKLPAFAPDATYGSVKYLDSQDLADIGLQVVLGNGFHLSLRPGVEVIEKMGGLARFMGWDKPVITDSGGYQAFSLVHRRGLGRVTAEGVEFRDPVRGDTHLLTPEQAIDNQLAMNSDVLVVLDYPLPPGAGREEVRRSLELTVKWAERSYRQFAADKRSRGRLLVAVVQGANDPMARRECYRRLTEVGEFGGYAFGGPVSEEEQNWRIIELVAGLIPDDKFKYMLGGATPAQIEKLVTMGWDLFDCVLPTRNARHGLAYTGVGEVRIGQGKYRLDKRVLDESCKCRVCRGYSRAYLRHLLKVGDPTGMRLLTYHNLSYYVDLMRKLQQVC